MNDLELANKENFGPETVASAMTEVMAEHGWSQYVTFLIDDRYYGVDITKVREIKGWAEPTELPNSPNAMRGVLNLRGVVVPIFDLRACFGQGETEASEEHVVIILNFADCLVGVLVDAVSDILILEPDGLLPVPTTTAHASQHFISGLVSRDDHLITLIRFEEMLGVDDIPSDLTF